jgi:hypothetical protein
MNVYASGNAIRIEVSLVDPASGAALSVQEVEHQLTTETGEVLIARSALAGFVAGEPLAVVDITDVQATVPVGAQRAARELTLWCTLPDGDMVILRQIFILEKGELSLEVAVNSYQTYASAMLRAMEIGNVVAWDAATEAERLSALTDAWNHIGRLNFTTLYAGTPATMMPVGEVYAPYGDVYAMTLINELTAEQLAELPPAFLAALHRAQVAEADAILGADPVGDARRSGMILETIGEVKQMYRGGKPLDLPVCRRALDYLSRYISWTIRIGR